MEVDNSIHTFEGLCGIGGLDDGIMFEHEIVIKFFKLFRFGVDLFRDLFDLIGECIFLIK